MRGLIILTLIAASPAFAETQPMTDAFGIAAADDLGRAKWAGYRETMQGQGETVAAGAGRYVQLYLGDKSLVAGRDIGVALALISDDLGNLVADGAEVSFTLGAAQSRTATQNGIALVRFGPFDVTGQFHAGAAIAGQQSSRQEFVVAPDLASVVPHLQPPSGSALAEDFTDIETEAMRDRFGNAVSDGTGMTVTLSGTDGSSSVLPAVVIGGLARTKFLARDVAGEGMLQAVLAANGSAKQPLKIAALHAVGNLAIKAFAKPDIAATELELGPFLTDGGHELNDGAVVTIDLATRHGALPAQTVWVKDGLVQLTVLATATDFPLSVKVTSPLGTVERVLAQQEVLP